MCLPAPPDNSPYDFTIFALRDAWSTSIGRLFDVGKRLRYLHLDFRHCAKPVFNIEWHVVLSGDTSKTGNFEVRLYENDANKNIRRDLWVNDTNDRRWQRGGGVQADGFFTEELRHRTLRCRTLVDTHEMEPCVTPTPAATPALRLTPLPRPRSTPVPRP